ncbi:uncharacterized protein LOC134686006 [Mytilus trossulus]|uniref:uncharacterized protein LOC134686006 n=1 Tax=Mytilus trossulus TaxID=6551 RepID=UPI00300633C7
MEALQTRNIENLTLTLKKHINTGMLDVRGCTLLPDGGMVFSSFGGSRVIVMTYDDKTSDMLKHFKIDKFGSTCDVISIGNDSIAVTSGDSYEINIIDIKNNKLKETIKLKSFNYGVAYKDGQLIYSAREKGLQAISLSDKSITDITNIRLPGFAYVTIFNDKLFFTNTSNHSVTCCDFHGNLLWMFYDESILTSPLGISADNDGNVFVVGFGTNNVVAISPDGQRYRQLLSRDDGLMNPTVLHYDTSTNKLLVANFREEAFVFQVQ